MRTKMKLSILSLCGIFAIMGTMTDVSASTTSVDITVEATSLNVTVPLSLPIAMKADGSVVLPTNFTVVNNSALGAVKIAKAECTPVTAKGWTLKPGSEVMNTKPANTKEMKLAIVDGTDKYIDPVTGVVLTKTIAASTNATLTFKADRPTFTSAITDVGAFNLILTLAWV